MDRLARPQARAVGVKSATAGCRRQARYECPTLGSRRQPTKADHTSESRTGEKVRRNFEEWGATSGPLSIPFGPKDRSFVKPLPSVSGNGVGGGRRSRAPEHAGRGRGRGKVVRGGVSTLPLRPPPDGPDGAIATALIHFPLFHMSNHDIHHRLSDAALRELAEQLCQSGGSVSVQDLLDRFPDDANDFRRLTAVHSSHPFSTLP